MAILQNTANQETLRKISQPLTREFHETYTKYVSL